MEETKQGYYQQYQKQNENMIYKTSYESLSNAFNNCKSNNADDVYITINKMKTAKGRTQENLKRLTTVMVDLDPIQQGTKKDRTILKSILLDLKENDLVRANFYNFTGNGCQIIFETKGDSTQIGFVYENVSIAFGQYYQDLINAELEKQGSTMRLKYDNNASRDKIGLMRLAGINSKTNETVIINQANNQKRTIQDLEIIQENLNIALYDREIKRPALKSKEHDILESRLQFLKALDLRKGMRDLILFHTYNITKQLWGNELAEKVVRNMNNELKEIALSEIEMKRIFRYLNNKGYLKYKNETFYLSLNADVPISKREAERLIARTEKEKIQNQAIELIQQNVKYAEIEKITGLSKRTLVRLKKSINNESDVKNSSVTKSRSLQERNKGKKD